MSEQAIEHTGAASEVGGPRQPEGAVRSRAAINLRNPVQPVGIGADQHRMTKVPPTTSLDDLRAEPFLAALVRSSDDAMIGKAPEGQVVLWGGADERLYGYQAA